MMERTCSCSMGIHKAPVEKIIIADAALETLPDVLAGYDKIYMVADENTYEAAGKKAGELLGDKLFRTLVLRNGVLPDEDTLGKIILNAQPPLEDVDTFAFSPLPDLILAVGSGTVNDSCRVASFRLGIPYAVAATAASMDGYASASSPMLFNGTKASVKATTARYVIADLDVIAAAPPILAKAGIGDMLAKYNALIEWELSRDLNGEYYCPETAEEVLRATESCADNSKLLGSGDHKIYKSILEGFMVTGLGMAYCGCVHPASGSEHTVGHAFELINLEKKAPPSFHGFEVAQGTEALALMWERLANETKDTYIKELYARYERYFDKAVGLIKELGLPKAARNKGDLKEGLTRALDLRNRYSLLKYLDRLGKYESYVEYTTEKLGKEL